MAWIVSIVVALVFSLFWLIALLAARQEVRLDK
jgi:hypothetical protein